MEQITIRLPEDVLDEIEGEADERGQSRSEYLRDVVGSRHESEADVERMRERIEALEEQIEALEAELADERAERNRLAGKVEAKDETIQAKDEHIDSVESTVYEQQQAMQAALSGGRGVFGRIRSALGSGSEQDSE